MIDSARFWRVYPNLPLAERSNVCCVVKAEPISWRVAGMEIKGKTKLGQEILEKLAGMGLI